MNYLIKTFILFKYIIFYIYGVIYGARGSVMVKALCYKSESRVLETR
jgi:hypothetical protein